MIGKKFQNNKSTGHMPQATGLKLAPCALYLASSILFLTIDCYAEDAKLAPGISQPITINGDQVEYLSDNKEVSIKGNAEVIYKGSKLSCESLKVNTETKEAKASGKVRIDDKKAVIEGSSAIYNFQDKTGTIYDSLFRANPYFGRANKVNKISADEFIATRGYLTTCSYDHPHYRMVSKKIDAFPGNKIIIKDASFYVGGIPAAYLPKYSRSLTDPIMHVQVIPGSSKTWGQYVLTAWRFNLTDFLNGNIYADERSKLGNAQGYGADFNTENFGKGNFKFYYTQERPKNFLEGDPAEFERYLLRFRHKWDIDAQTNLTTEYYKITDSKRAILGSKYNFLKDYFFREYEKDSQPLSYAYLHHNFSNSTLDTNLQMRINRWYSQAEELPKIDYSLPNIQIANSPLYFDHTSQVISYHYKNAVPSPKDSDINASRLDTTNRITLPLKAAFLNLNPFASIRETFYNKDVNGSTIAPRTIFYSGTDVSTKFYRIFNVKSDFMSLGINGLRHIITPTIGYSYNHRPTIPSYKLKQIDSIDRLGQNHSASLGLYNKFQTKRNEQAVDIIDLNVTNSYTFKPKGGGGSSLSDFLISLELIPYSWLSINADTTYKYSGPRTDPNNRTFSNINYDLNFSFSSEKTLAIGQRYQRNGENQITESINWRLTPKWKFYLYQSRNIGSATGIKKGLREQEYSLTRDLHCWTMDINYNVRRGNGETIWFIFKLKAFPEMQFGYDQTYHSPKPGSQSS